MCIYSAASTLGLPPRLQCCSEIKGVFQCCNGSISCGGLNRFVCSYLKHMLKIISPPWRDKRLRPTRALRARWRPARCCNPQGRRREEATLAQLGFRHRFRLRLMLKLRSSGERIYGLFVVSPPLAFKFARLATTLSCSIRTLHSVHSRIDSMNLMATAASHSTLDSINTRCCQQRTTRGRGRRREVRVPFETLFHGGVGLE